MGPEILYTTGAGKGVKVSVAIFPSSGGGAWNRVADWYSTTILWVVLKSPHWRLIPIRFLASFLTQKPSNRGVSA